MELSIRPGLRANQIVVTPVGDIDLYASVSFCNTLDFAGVRYLDSSGVGALIRLLQKSRAAGGEVRLVNLTGTPKKVLEMSNIIHLLKVAPDVESALRAWA